MKILFALLSLLFLASCAVPKQEYTVCKPYLRFTETGSEVGLWDINNNRDAGNSCSEVLDPEFPEVIVGS